MPHADGSLPIARFDAVLEAAIGESGALVMRALQGADRLMLQASGATTILAERQRIADAAAALRGCRQVVQSAFPAFLREEMAGTRAAPAAARAAVTFDSLELMADDQVDDAVELVRGQQLVKAAVEQDLVPLNALVSAAQGHEQVRASFNPLRPEVWVSALNRSLRAAKAPAAMCAQWMFHVSQALGPQLATCYQQLCVRLRQEGVSAAAYRVAAPKDAGSGEQRAAAVNPTPLTLRDLKSLLASVARDAGTASSPTPAGGNPTLSGMTMPAAMEALQGMKRMDDVVRRMQERWRQGVWQAEAVNPQDAPAVAGTSYTPTQTLAREVVRLMVANMTADPRLLAEVQQAVRRLEPALLRLVLRDQRFFSDRQHPARQLLEEVTQRSLAWPSPATPGFNEFLQPLNEAAQLLAQMPVEDAEPFEYALQTLRQTWAESEEHTRRQRASMARTLQKADERNHLAAQLAAHLRERQDLAGAPPEVRRFLLGPWCQAMAAARLAAPEGTADPGGFGAIVDDLVWIAQPRLAAQDPGRRATLVASLRDTLGAGLARIGYSQQETGACLGWLAGVQARASRGSADADSAADARPGASATAADAVEAAPWLSPAEVSDSTLMQAQSGDGYASTGRDDAAAASMAAIDVDQLQPGRFVEVQVRGHWNRWQLSWVSSHGMLYMFTDPAGRPESMTRQILEKLLALGAMRPLSSASLVDGALDAVAREALENSARMPQ